ncbi:MAG: hypothetical protein U9Q69_00990 [Nanoarchaeota archaeon]|nr:hypothetical protein [Nanoarchaeota archaeon]
MMNKRGYLKTLEAVISIVAILLFTFGVTPSEMHNPHETPFTVENSFDYITETLENDDTYRDKILNSDNDFQAANDSITNLVINNLPPGYGYEFKICDETTCLAENPPLDASVYSDDVIIAGTPEIEPEIKIVRIWFWTLL